jgi:hypothetical protein
MKHAWIYFVLFAFTVACGDKEKPAPAMTPALTLSKDGRAIATLTSDDAITDSRGAVVGKVNWNKPEVSVGSVSEVLAFDILDNSVSVVTAMGTFDVTVDDANQMHVNGAPAGTLAGFARTKDGWRRLAALVLAIPMLPSSPEGSAS